MIRFREDTVGEKKYCRKLLEVRIVHGVEQYLRNSKCCVNSKTCGAFRKCLIYWLKNVERLENNNAVSVTGRVSERWKCKADREKTV